VAEVAALNHFHAKFNLFLNATASYMVHPHSPHMASKKTNGVSAPSLHPSSVKEE